MHSRPLRLTPLLLLALAAAAAGADKNGVAPQAISLPSGPGSIQGLGESFQPQLNTGSGGTSVPIVLPRGTGGFVPELGLAYNTGAGNGSIAVGWMLSGLSSVKRNTDRGVPFYTDGPNGLDDDLDAEVDNPEELDAFTGIGGEELVPLADGTFRAENEAAFFRYTRVGAGWEARSRDGRRLLFGQSPGARIEEGGRIFEWCLERITDRNGNAIDYEYLPDPASPAQKHLRRIRWGQAGAFFAAVLSYAEGRPDVASSFRSGFELKTSLRLSGIDVVSRGIPAPAFALRGDLSGDGGTDALIRRYRLEYDAAAHLSLLTRVTLFGADGATTLPSQSFAYGPWAPPDSVAASLIHSRGAPAEGFESPSAELIDMNGDGLPDLLSTAGSQHRVFLNKGIAADGRLAWSPGIPVGNAPPIDLASDRTHLADSTADGLSDLLVKVSNTSFQCYDNTSENSWTGAGIPIRNTDTWPIWPYDGEGGRLSRSFDSDYSRSNDVFHTSATGGQLWLMLPGGRFSRELRLPPLICEGKVFRFDLPGTHIADLNGDRLQDLAWIQASRVVLFANRGRGDFADPIILNLGRTLSAAEIERTDFSDLDGDGVVDLTVVRPASLPGGIVYWLNRFEHGLDGPRTVIGLPAQQAGEALRWADMNGNGTTDIVISRPQAAPGEKILVIDLSPAGKPHLLERSENGLGLTLLLSYETSTVQMVRAEAAGRPWASRMPMPVTVVSRLVEEDGLSPARDQTITYRDPHYDPVKQEFRGFREAESRLAGDASAPGQVTRSLFDTGRTEACLKGKLLAQEVRGEDDKLFQRSIASWGLRQLAAGSDGRSVCYAFNEAADEFVYEGEEDPIRQRTEMDYDDFGNAIAERRHGILETPGDEIFISRSFDVRPAPWLLDLLARETISDGQGVLAADRRLTHDARGNLELEEAWLDREQRWVISSRQTFDVHGNVIATVDGRGGRRSMEFDALLHVAPLTETIHLEGRDLTMSAEYDLGFGLVTTAVDFSGQRNVYKHDPLGRLIAADNPSGAGQVYEYQPGNPVSRVVKRLREDLAGGTFDSFDYSDGRGRPLGSKVEAGNGSWRFLDAKAYNARQLAARSWLPHATATPDYEPPEAAAPHDDMTYDAQGRLLETVKADGTRTRNEYRRLEIAVHDGSDLAGGGGPDLRQMDGLGRLVAVRERNGTETYLTTYAWNARGELQAIVDALGNTRRFRFDSLGRLMEVDDPDRGLGRYAHDDTGNVVQREDARGQVIEYRFDAAHRTLEKAYRGAGAGGSDVLAAAYHYDEPAGDLDLGDGTRGTARHTLGRLAWVEDPSGEEHFSYDERGNIEWVLKRVRDPATGLLVPYRTQRTWDLLGRESAVVFPDNDRLEYVRGPDSFITRIQGGPQGGVVLAGADYAASGQALGLRLGNGVEESFAYDPGQRLRTYRLEDAQGSVLRHEELAYDPAANVAAITDLRPLSQVPADSALRTSADFTYDELHRLTRASYGVAASGGRLDYSYDALGNLLAQTTPPAGQPGHIAGAAVHLGALSYAGGRSGREGRRPGDPPGPHAPSGTAAGHRFAYDDSGNMTALDGAELAWDFEDRLASYRKAGTSAAYLHDHGGERVLKRVTRNGAGVDTFYVDSACEVERGAVVKYAFLAGRRLARIRGALDPTRERVQVLRLASGWNLVAAAVTTAVRWESVFGAGSSVYEARGASYGPLAAAAAVPAGRGLWVHVPSARLAYLRGQPLDAGPVDSAGPLHAWPRLAPFRPARDLDAPAVLMIHDAAAGVWQRRDASLPAFLANAPEELAAAQAFWSPGPLRLDPGAAEPASVIYYHRDVVGSTAAITGAGGTLIEERTHYPFGAVRAVRRVGDPLGGADHDFTGKERDAESGLIAMGARSCLDLAGIFLSPDPKYAAVAGLAAGSPADEAAFAAFLANPQLGNLYAYAARNPLKFVDPSGLDVVFSKALKDSPVFQEALDLFKSTKEGQRLLARLEKSSAKVTVSAGRVFSQQPKTRGREVLGQATIEYNTRVTLNLHLHKKMFASKDLMILELADTIHHELRHAEGNVNTRDLAQARRILGALDDAAATMKLPRQPLDPRLRMGREVHKGLDTNLDDPYNSEFRRQAEAEQAKRNDEDHVEVIDD